MNRKIVILIACFFMPSFCFAEDDVSQFGPVKVEAPVKNKIGELTGTFDLTSNYIFRGLTASNNTPAVQGGFTYTFLNPGIYINVWSSSTSLPVDTIHNETASIEIDGIVGIRKSITKNLAFDISFARYFYPKAPHFQFNEFLPKFSYTISNVTITPSLAYTPNVFNLHRPATYYNLRGDWNIPDKYVFHITNLTASGSFGRWYLPHGAGLDTYNDYMLGLTKTINNYVLMLQWINTSNAIYQGSVHASEIVGTVLVNF
jgi:uncharacterized protein (TIGR02001 family)